ncbi:MAG: UTP--glucose-1-phosphate uridylyltransferase [Candidatus Gracilibacteria bacterium]
MNKPVRKAVILAAGLGTRFLPMTKVIPKAMLPILNKPVIQYLVEEAVASGIEEIIIVTGLGKRTIEEHFDPSYELEYDLIKRGKQDLLTEIRKVEKAARFIYVHQNEARGDGHALLCAKDLIGDEPFAVLFCDDIIDGPRPALTQLLDVYKEKGSCVLCTERVPKERISNYGIISPGTVEGRHIQVTALVEKPTAETAPSDLGIIGKYICTPDVLAALARGKPGQPDGEIRLIDGFRTLLAEGQPIYALEVEGTRYDTGTPWGLLEVNMAFARKDPDLKERLENFLKK